MTTESANLWKTVGVVFSVVAFCLGIVGTAAGTVWQAATLAGKIAVLERDYSRLESTYEREIEKVKDELARRPLAALNSSGRLAALEAQIAPNDTRLKNIEKSIDSLRDEIRGWRESMIKQQGGNPYARAVPIE